MMKSSASKLRCQMVLPSTAYSNYRTRPLVSNTQWREKKLKKNKKVYRAFSEVCLLEEELNKVQEAQSAPSYLQDGVKAVEEKLEQINLFLVVCRRRKTYLCIS
jgi:hypothetical protein